MKLLRHFIAIDDDLQAVVLVIRGTQSHSGWNIDAQGMSMPFCHGVAHAGIGTMAHALMAHSKGEIPKALEERPNYRLVITGHSLGSGMACLVNILCHSDNDIGERNIECHAFGGPPVYLKGEDDVNVWKERSRKAWSTFIEKIASLIFQCTIANDCCRRSPLSIKSRNR